MRSTTSRTTSPSSGGQRYGRIAAELEAAIGGGRYPVGALMPTEAELCRQYKVSRHTVRRALAHLMELALVERRQGAATRVIATTPRAAYVHTIRSLHELFEYTRDTVLEIAEMSVMPIGEDEAGIIPAPPRSHWLRLTGLRWSADRREAICHATVLVHGRFAPILSRDLAGWKGPVYALVEERSGEIVAEALQEIAGGTLPDAAAHALKLEPGAPGVRVVRRYIDASGGAMLTSVNWHPAGRFKYRMRLRRDAAG